MAQENFENMADLTSQPTPIQTLYSLHNEGKLYVNRRYQRKLVWTLLEKQKLIESIQKKYPIPAILIAARDESPGSFEIIDGLQRLQAIVSFIETSFPTLDGKLFNIKHFPTAKARADEGKFIESKSSMHITQREIGNFLDYTLAISVMRNASEAEINDVFDRINTYGRRLSDQERRQSGVQNDFSALVRDIACTLRGDSSEPVVLLERMPSISIDLPKAKHGYEVQAEEVFWVKQGILRATDLRDSMDEQCIADIAASIIGGELIDRSKDALDSIYTIGSNESNAMESALDAYGSEKFSDEFKFCVDEILKVCSDGTDEKLRDIVFKKRTTNAFPSIFAVLLIAFHELLIKNKKKVSNYTSLKKSLINLSERIGIGRKATSPDERRKNVNTVKGLIEASFITRKSSNKIYGNHATTDIQSVIRTSEIEVGSFELKQGILSLSGARSKPEISVVEKILKTMVAIANNGPHVAGKILLGVADKESDAKKIEKIDNIKAIKVSKRFVVGVYREAKALGWTHEEYFTWWKNKIKDSKISEPLKSNILSALDFTAFYGLGVMVVTIPRQRELSYFDDEVYWRSGDSTELAKGAKQIADLARRF